MQSRRHEDDLSFDRSCRNAVDIGRDGYVMMSPDIIRKRSWSPRRVQGPGYSERLLANRRSVSLERRIGVVDDGSRRVRRSRSPLPYMEAKRERGRAVYEDDWVSERPLGTPERRSRYEFLERVERKREDVDEFGYGRGGSSRTSIMDERVESRRLESGVREITRQKSPVMGMYRLSGDVGPTSKTESGADLSSASLNVALGQLGKERVQYPEVERVQYPDVRDSFGLDKYTAMKQYGDREETMASLRDAPYSSLMASRSKESVGASHYKEYEESVGASHFKDYARTSPRKSSVDHLGYRGSIPIPRENHPLETVRLTESLSHSRYEQRQHLDHVRDRDLDINEDVTRYRREIISSPRSGHVESLHLQPRTRERDEYLYPSDEMYEKMKLRERVDYNGRDVLRPNMLETSDYATRRVETSDNATRRAETFEFAREHMGHRSSLDHLSLEKLTASNNTGLSRSLVEIRESGQYLDHVSIHSRLGRKVSSEREMPYMGMPQDRETEHVRVDYRYERDVGSGSQRERIRSPPRFLYDTERLGLSERGHKMERCDISPYDDSSSRYLKRKYTLEDEDDRITSRTMMSRPEIVSRRHNHDYHDEERIDEDGRSLIYSKRRDHPHGFSRKVDDVYEDEFLYHDRDEFIYEHHHDHHHDYDQDHRMKSYKYEDKYAKDYPRSSGRVGGYNSHHPIRRNVHPKWKNAPIRREIDEDDMYSGDIEQYEPHTETEEFKQLVHEHFLTFTKKLNDHPGVRRRYMEQGRAGSLFCIVCGRSLSKEFLDTQRLAMHAFMSHKGGLRAQHLGLLKAICVMLGWNSVIPPKALRWFPEILSTSETMAQKQDLIIWPPVIIVHNTSISNDSDGQGPTTLEALGHYLRGKGLSGGKVKLGNHANCSIMLITFLGTFTALQAAEKIHKYFAKNKHGRKDLDRITSSMDIINNSDDGENKNEDKEVERVLFGYMGIAEDLDKIDSDSKRKCSIKSKKEIQDLADGPVKPE